MLYQVNRVLFRRLSLNSFHRNKSSALPISKVLYPLENRKLIQVSGNDASVFLQGLMTNDMRHFEEGAKSIYAMFLNNKGRVLFDTLIHQWDMGQPSFLIECDQDVFTQLKKHLNLFKLKRLVKVEDVNENYKVWVLVSTHTLTNVMEHNLKIYKDPRLSDLGFRIIAESSLNGLQIASAVKKDISVENNAVGYKYLRYKLGVSEGAEDLPPGSTFPLEVNCDYLHGVSFHKGCYIGQELTARVHHTGVVRKRIMPLKFLDMINEPIDKDIVISTPDKPKSNLGKLKGYVNDCGIGLVRIKDVLDAKVLNVGKYSVEIIKPNWWPIEAPKEKSNIKMD